MKRVHENVELFNLLTENGFEFMRNWFYISSEGSKSDFSLVDVFMRIDYKQKFLKVLGDEQGIYQINGSICIIKGMVGFVLFKN